MTGLLLTCLLVAVVCELTAASAPVACAEDWHCPSGYHCDARLFQCRECLDCDQLRRAPPAPGACARNLADCGPCADGLVEDARGEQFPCVGGSWRVPALTWVAIAVALLAAAAALLAYPFWWNHCHKLVLAYRSSHPATTMITPDACEVPPPYNYNALPRASQPIPIPIPVPIPTHSPTRYGDTPTEGETYRLVKCASSWRRDDARVSAGNQSARVFNAPAYVRPPPSYDSSSEEDTPRLEPPVVHDEDTMESTWTPQSEDSTSSNMTQFPMSICGPSSAPAQHTDTTVDMRNISQDSNNNQQCESPAGAATAPPSAGPALVINIVKNINTVHQSMSSQ